MIRPRRTWIPLSESRLWSSERVGNKVSWLPKLALGTKDQEKQRILGIYEGINANGKHRFRQTDRVDKAIDTFWAVPSEELYVLNDDEPPFAEWPTES